MEGGATIWCDGVGAGQRVDAPAVGIGIVRPDRFGDQNAAANAIERSATLTAARTQHPERFSTTTDPKILALPGATWINKPAEKAEEETDQKLAA